MFLEMDWGKCYNRFYAGILLYIPESATFASANVSESQNWFSHIEKYLKYENRFSILGDPKRVLNLGEDNFQLRNSIR